MDPQQFLMMLPGLQPDELILIQELSRDMSENQKQQFFMMYQNKRKDQQTLLLLTAIGFLGIAGIQRFIIGEIGMGVLFLITFGFCGIGTIIDMVNNKSIAYDFNRRMALESADMVRFMSK